MAAILQLLLVPANASTAKTKTQQCCPATATALYPRAPLSIVYRMLDIYGNFGTPCKCIEIDAKSGAYRVPGAISVERSRSIAAAVSEAEQAGLITDRGAGLTTKDIEVKALPGWVQELCALAVGNVIRLAEPYYKSVPSAASDFPLSMEDFTSQAFVIVYDAAGREDTQSSLRKHKDGHDGLTVLITLTQSGTDFTGGGTRFFTMDGIVDARPDTGGGVFFAADGTEYRGAKHAGLDISSGRRLVLAYFLDTDSFHI